MELVLKHPDDAPVQRAKDLAVIVVCEDGTTAPRACALLHRVGRNAGPQGRLIYSWWTFAVLASPSVRHLASREAVAADMIVVAARDGQSLPEPVKDYLSLWLADRDEHPRPRALVALLESDPKHGAATRGVLSELKHLAESAAVDFFANGDEVSSDSALLGGGSAAVRQFARVCQPARGADCRAARAPASTVAAGLERRQPNRKGQEQNANSDRTKTDIELRRNRPSGLGHLAAGRLSTWSRPGTLAEG